jgi:predicted TIM-barrel fold metal-dependent hydrolase
MKKRRQAHKHPEMTPQEMARCRPASEVDQLGLPIPTHLVSNEEYFPPFLQTAHQRQVEARVLDTLDHVPKRLNISRRKFLETSAGLAASFMALNEVFKDYAHGDSLFRVGDDAAFDHAAFAADGPPADLFVFDDQCHLARGAGIGVNIGHTVRAIAQGESARLPNSPFVSNPWNPNNHPDEHGVPWGNWNPALVGRTNFDDAEYWLPRFIESYYFESQTTVALLSNINMVGNVAAGVSGVQNSPAAARNVYEARPQEAFLTAEQNFACREFINSVAGSTRALSHGLMYLGPGNLWYLQEQIDRFSVDSWKGYQAPNAKRNDDPEVPFEYWRFDDEELAFPTFAFIQEAHRKHRSTKPGLNCICVHKGLDDSAIATDIPAAAAAFPDLNFVIYHSCFRPAFFDYEAWQDLQSGRLRDGVPDIKHTTEFAQLLAPYPNVYAELGTIFASSVVTFPTLCAHLMGILFKYLGADRIVWGTDSTFYGSPQWQIEAFWRLQIPDEMRRRYGYPEITPEMKRKVLGLNSARLYGMTPDVTGYGKVAADYATRIADDAQLLRTMEYDDRLANDPPVQPASAAPYGVASARRGDRLERLRDEYREAADTGFGVPRSNQRAGWIRVK